MKNKIKIEDVWNAFEADLDINKTINFFALSSILRVIIEKENLKNEVQLQDYSIIHNFLHWESINTDKSSYLISIINILEMLPTKYNHHNIKKQILDNLPDEAKFWKIFAYGKKVEKNHKLKIYKLKIINISYFSFINNEMYFFYTAEKLNNGKRKRIFFISKNKFSLINIYNFSFQYVTINYSSKIFMEIEYENLSSSIQENILKEYNVSNYKDLLTLLNDKSWPFEYKYINERNIFAKIYFYHNTHEYDKKTNQDFFPFFRNPYLSGLLKNKKEIDNIIESYNTQNTEIMNNNKKWWDKEVDWKNTMDKNNTHLLEINEDEFNLYNSWNCSSKNYKSFKTMKKDENFYIYDEKIKRKYEIIEKFFNSENRNFKEKISGKKINDWFRDNDENASKAKDITFQLNKKGILILFAPAGYGKTFCLKKIIKFYLHNNLKVKLICPTWKSISLFDYKIESSTVEKRNREWIKIQEGTSKKNDDFFDNVDLLIIDEISLISDWNFISGIKAETQVIFSGDMNQLSFTSNDWKIREHEWIIDISNENNLVFDLKKNKGKNYRLSNLPEDHSGPKILENLIDETFDWKKNISNVSVITSMQEIIEKLVEFSKKNYTIITKFNSGMWGVEFLNWILSNNNSENFSKGDKIIFVDTERFSNIDKERPTYYNGLSGEITSIDTTSDKSEKYIIKTDVNEVILYIGVDEDISDKISHSYVTNAHKAQGMTIENVLVLSPNTIGYDWMYTAASRFSKNLEIIFISVRYKNIEFVKRLK